MFDCSSFLRRKGWTQKELAERLNVSTAAVGMWCIGKSTPSYAIIEELLRLGITPAELFGSELAALLSCRVPDDDDKDFEEKVRKALFNLLR